MSDLLRGPVSVANLTAAAGVTTTVDGWWPCLDITFRTPVPPSITKITAQVRERGSDAGKNPPIAEQVLTADELASGAAKIVNGVSVGQHLEIRLYPAGAPGLPFQATPWVEVTTSWDALMAALDGLTVGCVKIVCGVGEPTRTDLPSGSLYVREDVAQLWQYGAPDPSALCFVLDTSFAAVAGTVDKLKEGVQSALAFIRDNGAGLDIAVVACDTAATSEVKRAATAADIDDLIAWVGGLSEAVSPRFNTAGALTEAKTFFDATDAAITTRRMIFVWDGVPDYPSGSTSDFPAQMATAQVVAATMPDVLINMVNIEFSDTSWAEDLDNTPEDGVPVAATADDLEETILAVTADVLYAWHLKSRLTSISQDGVELTGDARSLNFTGGAVALTSDGKGNVEVEIAGGGSDLGWFNVRDYGAVGDGSTDDTAAINSAIADLNAAGAGVLYCPGTVASYLASSALTPITAVGMVLGDGMDGNDQNSATQAAASLITCTSATAALFTINAKTFAFRNIGLKNTAGGTPSAGAGIVVTSSNYDQKVDYDTVSVEGFYIDIDVQVGSLWTMRNCFLDSPVLYALKIRNTASADAGDWSISDTSIYPNARNATAAINITSSGGGKIVNCKINGGLSNKFTNGIELTGGVSTSILLVTNTSIENYSGTGIVTSGLWQHQVFTNLEFGQYGNSSGHAISVSSTTDVIIDNIALRADTGTPTAIVLSSVTRCVVGNLTNNGFGTLLSGTPDQDRTGGVGAGVQITGTPSAGQVPVASSSTAAAWGTPTGAVSSVFTRTGAVVAAAGDYAASQVSNDSSVAGSTVKDALNTLSGAVSGSWIPLVDGSEPPVFITDGTGNLVLVAYS